jgi:phenylpyruvate tautomerase PptA (4-oxalocrotonate tautomerase family)
MPLVRIDLLKKTDPGFAKRVGYLGIRRTPAFVLIQITLNEGRTLDQKKALYKTIADSLHQRMAVPRGDVFINLVEVKKENWSFGDGIAQYA